MSCTSCSTGTPNGCKSNGGCSTGGCNRMNVHDWLANLPFSDPESGCRIVEVRLTMEAGKTISEITRYKILKKAI